MRHGDFAVTRCVALSLVVLSLSLAGHAAGTAVLPSTLGVFLALVLSIGLTTLAIARPRSWAWLAGYLLAAQALIHVVLVISGSGHHAASAAMTPLVPSASMVGGHVAASVVAATVLASGERALRSWAALLSAALDVVFVAVRAVDDRPRTFTDRGRWVVRSRDADTGPSRRGPPAVALA